MDTPDKKYLKVEDLSVYNSSFNLSNKVWDIVVTWNQFAQNTVGSQVVRSSDSISANIAEGFGRFGKRDKVKFYSISRASVLESKDWLNKALIRKLINKDTYELVISEFEKLPKQLNYLIKVTNEKLKQ